MPNEPSIAPAAPGICSVCGCSELDPCYEKDYGLCGWANEDRTICTRCAREIIARNLAEDGDEEPMVAPRVIAATEAECDRFIRARRAAAGG